MGLANNLGGSSTLGQLLLSILHILHQFVAVSLAGYHLKVNIFNVAALNVLLEHLLLLIILSLKIGIAHLNIIILDGVIGDGSQQDVALFVLTLESHLCRYGVREQTLRQQTLILLTEQLLTEVLLHELPVVVDARILLSHLGIATCLLHLLIVGQELGQLADVETSRLLIDKRCLHEHGIRTCFQHILKFFISHRQTQFLGLGFDDGVVDKLLPYLILNLVKLVFRQIVTTLRHLDDLLILVD